MDEQLEEEPGRSGCTSAHRGCWVEEAVPEKLGRSSSTSKRIKVGARMQGGSAVLEKLGRSSCTSRKSAP